MLRLLPDTVHVGLFPGASWLQHQNANAIQPIVNKPVHDPHGLLHTLKTMLDAETTAVRKGSKITVTVSDSTAAVMTLPWQPALSQRNELHNYARICFERTGVTIDDDWVMHTEFRQYGAMGLAYALPKTWVIDLVDLLKTRGLKLKTVLPVTAKAYSRHMPRPRAGKAMVLLRETLRSSALLVNKDGLCGYDVEPLIGSSRESSLRLLKRVVARHGEVGSVIDWSLDLPVADASPDFISGCLPGSSVQCEAQGLWSW